MSEIYQKKKKKASGVNKILHFLSKLQKIIIIIIIK